MDSHAARANIEPRASFSCAVMPREGKPGGMRAAGTIAARGRAGGRRHWLFCSSAPGGGIRASLFRVRSGCTAEFVEKYRDT